MALSRRTFVWTLVSGALTACSTDSKDAEGGPDGSIDPIGNGGSSSGSSGGNGSGNNSHGSGNGSGSSGDNGEDPDGGSGETPPPDAGTDGGSGDLPPVASQPPFGFDHGVASGDPLSDRVILWTRLTPTKPAELAANAELLTDFVVASDKGLLNVIGRGRARTSAARDFTVKVDVDGLRPGTTYYYQFFDPANRTVTSSIGRTKTLPTGATERARFGVVSCSCYALGYFNAYAFLAGQADLDAILHLGDYIYEYGPEMYDDKDLGRSHEPAREILTLDDYRQRHRQYKSDPDLQEAHRQHPFVTVWDDHEIANDAYDTGAENHTEGTEGAYADRKKAGFRAYHEWMPIRDLDPNDDSRIYRTLPFGDLLDLHMLETRASRAKPDRAQINTANRSMMGEVQTAWLQSELSKSLQRGATWRLLGQQVMMGQLKLVASVLNADQWDGYETARVSLLDYVEQEGIDNLVILTGDIHSSWANEVAKNPYSAEYEASTGKGSLATEYVCTSVTSPGLDALAGVGVGLVLSSNPHMKWANLDKRGCLLIDVDHTRVQGDWFFVNNIKMPSPMLDFAKAFQTISGKAQLVSATTAVPPRMNAPDLAP